MDIFEAARAGKIDVVRQHIESGADLAQMNDYKFTALHCAAMGTNSMDKDTALTMVKLLVDAGSPLESVGNSGRTPLYLMAEFSNHLEPLQYLVEAGANPDVSSEHNVHVVINANTDEVQEYLSKLTGFPIPPPPPPRPKAVKLNATAWKKAKADLDMVFSQLEKAGLIVLQNAGTTQDDGFSDCSEIYHGHADKAAIKGFCFYTGQDLSRAKRSGELTLAFWGAPEGEKKAMLQVGQMVTTAFTEAGFVVDWNGSGSMRPSLYLHKYAE